jgi:hypothetical protein
MALVGLGKLSQQLSPAGPLVGQQLARQAVPRRVSRATMAGRSLGWSGRSTRLSKQGEPQRPPWACSAVKGGHSAAQGFGPRRVQRRGPGVSGGTQPADVVGGPAVGLAIAAVLDLISGCRA